MVSMVAIVKTIDNAAVERVKQKLRGITNLIPGLKMHYMGYTYLSVDLYEGANVEGLRGIVGEIEGVLAVVKGCDD